VEDWNNGMMGLRAKNISIRNHNCSVALHIKQGTRALKPFVPSFQHSNIPRFSSTGKTIET
jgi:hypothetical protein